MGNFYHRILVSHRLICFILHNKRVKNYRKCDRTEINKILFSIYWMNAQTHQTRTKRINENETPFHRIRKYFTIHRFVLFILQWFFFCSFVFLLRSSHVKIARCLIHMNWIFASIANLLNELYSLISFIFCSNVLAILKTRNRLASAMMSHHHTIEFS